MSKSQSSKSRQQCPDCPDGYVWTKNGPTDKACQTCGGNSYIEADADREMLGADADFGLEDVGYK